MPIPSNSSSEGRNINSPGIDNELWQYVQSQPLQNPRELSHLMSKDAMEIVAHHIRSMLGVLPSQQFDVQIATTRDGLAQLLTGAMVTGYFLRDREQRLQLERTLSSVNGDD